MSGSARPLAVLVVVLVRSVAACCCSVEHLDGRFHLLAVAMSVQNHFVPAVAAVLVDTVT